MGDGQSSLQLGHLIKASGSKKALQDLLGRMQMKTHIPALHKLSLKADLGLSWAGLRELKL